MDLMGVTGVALKAALDAASLRQQAGSANIANATTPGYQPLRVEFEQMLENDLRAYRTSHNKAFAPSAPKIVKEAPLEIGMLGSSVRLDEETAKLAINAIHYQALLKAVQGQASILSTAIGDGKR